MPYRRLEVLFAAKAGGSDGQGVRATVVETDDPYRWVHDPDHPDAIQDTNHDRFGQVLMPKITQVQEMVDMMLASRAYEANLTAIDVSKSISTSVSRIIA